MVWHEIQDLLMLNAFHVPLVLSVRDFVPQKLFPMLCVFVHFFVCLFWFIVNSTFIISSSEEPKMFLV